MKKTILIPDNINGITLGQYQKYLLVAEGIEGEFLNQRAIETLCGVPFADVVNMSHKNVQEIVIKLSEILEDNNHFVERFKIEGVEFGFIPCLEEITSGEYADLSAYMTKPEDMHKAMSVMFRPIIERYKDKYKISEYNGTKDFADVMKFMPLGAALGAMVFFWTLAKDLVNATQRYTQAQVMEELEQHQDTSQKSGVFTKTFMLSQKEILEDLMKSLKSTYTNV